MARRKSVQEQSKITKNSIEKTAYYWRSNELPAYLRQFLEDNAIDVDSSIVLEYDHNYPGMPSDFGLILTIDRRFFSFEVDNDNGIIADKRLEDVSEEYLISDKEKGIQKTYGFLAIQVLEEINSKTEAD